MLPNTLSWRRPKKQPGINALPCCFTSLLFVTALIQAPGIIPIGANLRAYATIYIKMLLFGCADAGRGNLPRLLCPLQNARSPKYSARYTGGEAEAAPLAAGGTPEANSMPRFIGQSHRQTGQRLPSGVRIANTQHFYVNCCISA